MPRHAPFLPFLAVAAGIGTVSMMDATIKSASLQAGVYSTLLLRSALGTGRVLPIWAARRGAVPTREVMRVHALRGAVVAAMAALFFYGLVRMPLAEGIALSFIAPLIALYLAAATLGETIRPGAVIALLLGIAGVVVIALARLGDADGSQSASVEGIVAVLCSAVLYAWNLVLQRKQAMVSGPLEVAMFQNLFVALALLPFAPWLWSTPGPGPAMEIAAGAGLATVSLMLLAWGYARAEAQVLLPLEYTGFGWAALFGWLWFAEPVAPATLVGTALIVLGCWLAARNAASHPDSPAVPHAP